MKTIIVVSLLLFTGQAFGQESSTKVQQNPAAEKTEESSQAKTAESEQSAVPIIGHKSTEPVEIELKIAEPATKEEESPE